MDKLIIVGTGGFIGASLRYVISRLASHLWGNQFAYGTLIVNVSGGILIGFILELTVFSDYISPNMKLFLTTGIMGGLTTFSSFSYETVTLFFSGDLTLSMLNIILNLVLSLAGVVLGKTLTHIIF